MKTAKIKSSILGSVFALLFVAGSFASMANIADTTSTKKTTKKVAKKKVAFTKEEQVFFKEIENYYQETFVKTTVETEKEETGKIVVYTLGGKLLHEQDASKKPIDLELLPKNAKYFMTEGNTRFYIVME